MVYHFDIRIAVGIFIVAAICFPIAYAIYKMCGGWDSMESFFTEKYGLAATIVAFVLCVAHGYFRDEIVQVFSGMKAAAEERAATEKAEADRLARERAAQEHAAAQRAAAEREAYARSPMGRAQTSYGKEIAQRMQVLRGKQTDLQQKLTGKIKPLIEKYSQEKDQCLVNIKARKQEIGSGNAILTDYRIQGYKTTLRELVTYSRYLSELSTKYDRQVFELGQKIGSLDRQLDLEEIDPTKSKTLLAEINAAIEYTGEMVAEKTTLVAGGEDLALDRELDKLILAQ